MKSFWMAIACVAALFTAALAIEPKLQENFGIPQYYSAIAVATSTHTVSGKVTSWNVMPIGGGCAFHIFSSSGTGFASVVSSTIYVSTGVSVSDLPRALTDGGMQISLDQLDAGATAYIDMGYLIPKLPGGTY